MPPNTNPPVSSQPPVPPTQPNAPPPPQPQVAPQSTTDTMGIISIVCGVIGLSLVGFVVGLIGASKAKKEGRSPVLSRVGWILGLIEMVVVILIFVIIIAAAPSLQGKARDTERKVDMAQIAQLLEDYHNKNSYYPSSLTELGSSEVTIDPKGQPYTYIASPAGCIKDCTGYEIQTTLETGPANERTYKLKSFAN